MNSGGKIFFSITKDPSRVALDIEYGQPGTTHYQGRKHIGLYLRHMMPLISILEEEITQGLEVRNEGVYETGIVLPILQMNKPMFWRN